ncbi:Uncharacterized protein FKW44_012963, partial [Caligus rogercresseyi]
FPPRQWNGRESMVEHPDRVSQRLLHSHPLDIQRPLTHANPSESLLAYPILHTYWIECP